MDAQHKKLAWFLALLVGVALAMFYYNRRTPVEAAIVNAEPDFYSPYYYTTPGVYPDYVPPESVVNVYVEAPRIPGVSDQFFPMFGLVGMTAV